MNSAGLWLQLQLQEVRWRQSRSSRRRGRGDALARQAVVLIPRCSCGAFIVSHCFSLLLVTILRHHTDTMALLMAAFLATLVQASPANVCSQAPYKALLPAISNNCFAKSFCSSRYPVPPVTVTTSTTSVTSTIVASVTSTVSVCTSRSCWHD